MIRLQTWWQITKWRTTVSRIEEYETSELVVGDNRHCSREFGIVRRSYCQDHMIEAQGAGKIRSQIITFAVDQNVVGIDSGRSQHCRKQRCFVFAVTIAASYDIGSGVRPVSADPNLDSYVSNAM